MGKEELARLLAFRHLAQYREADKILSRAWSVGFWGAIVAGIQILIALALGPLGALLFGFALVEVVGFSAVSGLLRTQGLKLKVAIDSAVYVSPLLTDGDREKILLAADAEQEK